MTTATQSEKVLDYLEAGRTLTSKQARARFGIQNLRARISELRAEGYNIATESVTFRDTGANGVKYYLGRRARRG
jgi:hypothetical protein